MADAGFVLATAPCVRCGRLFSFNPLRVPSISVNGSREPLCRPCVESVNVLRRAQRLPEWPIYKDSYDPVQASEMPW